MLRGGYNGPMQLNAIVQALLDWELYDAQIEEISEGWESLAIQDLVRNDDVGGIEDVQELEEEVESVSTGSEIIEHKVQERWILSGTYKAWEIQAVRVKEFQ